MTKLQAVAGVKQLLASVPTEKCWKNVALSAI